MGHDTDALANAVLHRGTNCRLAESIPEHALLQLRFFHNFVSEATRPLFGRNWRMFKGNIGAISLGHFPQRTFWTSACSWVGAVARKDDRNETWVLASVCMPCSGRGRSVFGEAAAEVESIIVDAPRYDHLVLTGDHNLGFGRGMLDGETIGDPAGHESGGEADHRPSLVAQA